MRAIVAFGFLLVACSSLQAASLKNLSEKLTLVDRNEEKSFSVNPSKPSSDSGDEDDAVAELDQLKSHDIGILKNEVDDSLETSLKNLHGKNSHIHAQQNGEIIRRPTETNTTPKQKEVIEILPLPEMNEATTATPDKSGQLIHASKIDIPSPMNILRHLNGKFSAYDMSQYVFWTGDEEGVARAVEELIDSGLMSRENALEFLSDIRMGIDYLESTYADSKNANPISKLVPMTVKTEPPTEEIPFSYSLKYQKFHSFFNPQNKEKIAEEEMESPTLSPIAFKALEKLPSLLKLTEAHKALNKQQPDETLESYDDETGRSRVADYLYGEYSLEEVIYQLAKTMFAQSLTHGSEESQVALQKLTEFLEKEGKHGRISVNLQKKILDVLLAALSDTLNENPEIIVKVRHAAKN